MMRKLRALIQKPSFTKQTDFVIKGVPEKKYLSEISGSQIHVTIAGQSGPEESCGFVDLKFQQGTFSETAVKGES